MGREHTHLVLGIGLEEVPNHDGAFPCLSDEQRGCESSGKYAPYSPASDFPELR